MQLFTFILIIHITGGSLGLLTGTINMLRRKGDRNHRLVGQVFFYSMLAVGFSSLGLATMHPSPFLFIIGVLTLYLASTGKRYLYLRQLASDQKPKLIDWLLTIGMLIAGIAFIVFGIMDLIKSNLFGTLYIVFGIRGLLFVLADFKNYTKKTDIQNIWLVTHLQRMSGAYVAAVTAFVVVNINSVLPSIWDYKYLFFVPWILPTLVITPIIIGWSKKHEVKKKPQINV